MAYYNPQDSQDRYYSPEANTNQQGTDLGPILRTMGAAIALNVVGGLVTKHLVNASKNTLKSWSANSKSIIRKNIADKAISNYSSFKRTTEPIRASIVNSSIYKASQERRALLEPLKGTSGYGIKRVTSTFKNTKTFAATVGGVWKRNVLQGMAVAYGVDSALGFTREMGLEKKAIYDVPGQVGNFAKWLGYSSAGGLAFGAAGPVLGAIGGVGLKAVQRVFGGEFGRQVLDFAAKFADNRVDPKYTNLLSKEAQNFATDSVKKGLHFGRNVKEAYRGIQDATKLASYEIKTPGEQFGKRTKSSISVLSNAIKNSKSILNESKAKTKSEGNYHGLSVLHSFEEWAKSTERFKGQTKVAVAGSLDKFFAETHKLGNKESTLQKIFGGILQKSSLKDVVDSRQVGHILGNLENVYAKDEAQRIVKNILDIKVGGNIYKDWRNPHIKGGMVDLNFLDPVNMVRRTLAPVLNHQIYAPIVKSWFSLADITGTHRWINESPSMFATTHRPNFRTKEGGSVSDDIVNHDALYVYSKGGKWAIFDGGLVRTLDTGRSLHYAHKSGKDKSWELKDITVNRIRKLKIEGSMAEYNDAKNKMDHRTQPTNKWQGFFDWAGLGVPDVLKRQYHSMTARFQGKKNYELEFNNIFKNDLTGETLGSASPAIPLVNYVYGHTSQVLARVARNKQAMDILGNSIGQSDLAEKVLNDQFVLDKVHQLALDGRFRNDHDVIKAIEDMKAFPERSRHHIVTRSRGRFQDITNTDIVRTSYIDDVFNGAVSTHGDLAISHPLLNVAPDLFSKGIITKGEKDALELHAKLSVFRMRDNLIPGHVDTPETLKSVLGRVRDRANQNNWDMLKELTNFISNNEMRSPRIISSQEKVFRSKVHFAHDDHPFVSSPDSGIEVIKDLAEKVLDRSTDVLADWSPIRKYAFSNHGWQGNLKYLARPVGTVAAIGGAYRIVDTVTATNPLFDDTMLDEGITGAAADIVAKGRFGLAHVADITGVTSTMKYLHGLAPFSESALPGVLAGSMLGVFTKMSPLGVAKSALYGAIANRVLAPYLPDMTKSAEELKEIYAGRQQVPIMKAPTWALGGTPWEGSKVVGYSPNWYVRAKSRWKETDTMYGSAFRRLIHEPLPLLGTNIGDIIDPYYMERKHYFTRPYPVTGELFKDVPLIGGPLSSTIGRIIKPQKTMHQEYLNKSRMYTVQGDIPGDPYQFGVRPPTIPEGLSMMNRGASDALSTAGMANNFGKVTLMNNKYWSETGAEDFLYDIQNFAGLKGFLAGTVAERIFQTNKTVPTLESAGRIASMSRSYYDLNLGGMGVITEGIRRVIDKPEYRQYGINPIYNRMPNWLPSQFLTGDPYAKLIRGELRLPGSAYLATHTDVNRSMPARASMIGGTTENIVQYFAGLVPPTQLAEYEIMEEGTEFHRSIQQTLSTEGMLVQAEALVQDVKNDITGHVDAIIRDGTGGRGRRALEIKTINDKAFNTLDAPKNEHYSQLNFYLRMLKMRKGTLLYINRDNPTQVKTFEINYSQTRWEKDIKKLQKSREIAKTMMEEGVGDTLGYSYSWADRLKVLADAAPNSLEFKEAKQIVEKQIKFGVAERSDVEKYKTALKQKQARIRSYELYPDRFRGKILNPDSVANIQSINEDIKAAAEYTLPERIVGAVWEKFTNTNTFIINKLFAAKDPLEHYKITRLYGKEYKPWNEPIRGWIEPYSRGLASKTDPFAGAISYGFGGMILGGGPIPGAIAALGGAAYGTLHGAYRTLTGTTYIPESVQEKREIISYFDAAKYERNNMLASLSTGLTQQEFLSQRDATLTAFNAGGKGATVANLFRGTAVFEKPYIESFLNTRNPKEREKILSFVPDDLATALKKQWGTNDSKEATTEFVANSSEALTKGAPKYRFDRSIMDPSVNLDDIKLKTVQEAGFDQFEFGLGWNEQMLRLQEMNHNVQAANIQRLEPTTEPLGPNISPANVRGMINNLFSKEGIKSSTQIYVDNTLDINRLEFTIRRDRSRSVINALNRREKYGM